MYYIVYLLKDKINIIVPQTWIKDINDHIEKFINSGLNSSQKFLCFWTESPHAFDENGRPKLNFEPDSNAEIADRFPHTGWHICKLKKCRGNVKNMELIDYFIILISC